MENYKVKLIVTDDGNKQVSSTTTSEHIRYMKEQHNINALDELLYAILTEINKK